MNFVSEYIKYLFNAKGRHGIHSPFVYEFVDTCLRLKPDADFLSAVKVLRNTLSADKTLVEIADFGAGSRKLGNIRSVRSIYKTASCKGVYADLLYQLAKHYRPQNILELGTSLGLGTIHLAAGGTQVFSVEACENTIALAQRNVDSLGLKNIKLINQTFDAFLNDADAFVAAETLFDLVYIDGHHEGKALKKYMSLLAAHTHENTIFILDDIRWSDDMFTAWQELSASQEFHLSMDLFRMGILVKRPGQVKEHFVVKLKNVLPGF